MRRIDEKLVIDYIIGNEVLNVDELEDDFDFMKAVILKSNDKQMYNLCSNSLKNNKNFVLFLIDLFYYDKDFIVMVANNYIKDIDVSENLDALEVNLKVRSLLTEEDVLENKKDLSFFLKSEYFYLTNVVSVMEYYNENYCDSESESVLERNFVYFMDEYGDRTIVMSFIAEKFLNEIFFKDEKYSFEQIIHSCVSSYEEIANKGINNFFLDYLTNIDHMLAWYVSNHIELLDVYKKELEYVKKEWDFYLKNLNECRVDMVYDELEKIRKEYDLFGVDCDETLDDLIRERGLEKEFCIAKENINNSSDNNKTNNFMLYKFKYVMSNYIDKLFSKDVIDIDYDLYNEEKLSQVDDTKKMIRMSR